MPEFVDKSGVASFLASLKIPRQYTIAIAEIEMMTANFQFSPFVSDIMILYFTNPKVRQVIDDEMFYNREGFPTLVEQWNNTMVQVNKSTADVAMLEQATRSTAEKIQNRRSGGASNDMMLSSEEQKALPGDVDMSAGIHRLGEVLGQMGISEDKVQSIVEAFLPSGETQSVDISTGDVMELDVEEAPIMTGVYETEVASPVETEAVKKPTVPFAVPFPSAKSTGTSPTAQQDMPPTSTEAEITPATGDDLADLLVFTDNAGGQAQDGTELSDDDLNFLFEQATKPN